MIKPSFWTPAGAAGIKPAPEKTSGMKSLTVCYVTSRPEPEFDWFLNSLASQINDWEQVEIIVVDSCATGPSYYQTQKIKRLIRTPPKPCIWQGPHRITTQDWWAKCNALNTALCLVKTDWVAFVDDRSVLAPTWLQSIREAMAGNYAVCGTYEKRVGMVVENGVIKAGGTIVARDNRYTGQTGPITANGGWWYGCTNALPLEWMLQMNGFPEKCDSVSFEDIITGMIIHNNGHPIKFDPSMKIIEDRTPEKVGPPCKRSSKERHPHDTEDKTHQILRWARSAKVSDNPFNMRELRDSILAGGAFPIPDQNANWLDWFDGQSLMEM